MHAKSNPLSVAALWFVDYRGAVSMIHAAVAVVSRGDIVDCTYPYMVGMQLNMLFAALFVFVNGFSDAARAGACMRFGAYDRIFQQYVIRYQRMVSTRDAPIFFASACVCRARLRHESLWAGTELRRATRTDLCSADDRCPFPLSGIADDLRSAAAAAVLLAFRHPASRKALPVAVARLCSRCGDIAARVHSTLRLALAAYVVRQLSHAAAYPPDW